MTTEKMVYVKSNDYWGYDASEFDNDANFYTYTWTVPESMYNAMDSDNQAKLFPCALFYVQGVTDNHNFLTLSIDVDGANAKVRGMQGAKRRTLKFESGVEYAYSVGSLTMKAAPAGSRSVATIESEVLTGVAATDGTFNVSSFLTDASDIASAVGLATASAAESYASEMEVSDFYPQSSAEIGSEQSGRGVPVAYGSGSSQYVEPPVLELGAEVIDDNYMDVYSAQGYNDKMDESLGMRDGAARKFRQSMKDRRNEAGAMDRKYGMRRKYEDVETMDAETASFGAMPSFTEDPAYLNHKTNDFERTDVTGAVMWRGKLMPCMWCGDKSRMVFGSRSDPMFVCESRECHNSLGIKNLTFDGMSPLQINSAESFGADMIYEGLPVIPDSYGTNSALSSGQGVPVWYGSAEGDDYSYEGTAGDIDIPIPADAGETNPMEFVELGAYDVPVIPNTVGTDSAGGSGYGVPQWYGADTFDADRMSTSLEESAPPKMGKKVGVVALIGLGLGAWMASRKN